LLIVCGLLLLAPALADDEEEGGGGAKDATLDANMQWRMACSAWDKHDFSTAAVLMENYANQNPDEPHAIEAWWDAYTVWRSNRPNPERKKLTCTKAMAACDRWVNKYAQTDKNRAAQALWYHAMLYDSEGTRIMAINVLKDLVAKFPGSDSEPNASWYLGEWLRDMKRFP
jgi:TolA-binding protein